MGHQERKLREKENVKKSILNAALKIAKKDGWESVTIRKIAEAVEYTTSIVYEHFENKDDLLNEITEQGFTKLNEEFENLFNKQGKPSEILLQLSIAHWDYVQKNKALYKLMFLSKKPSVESGMNKIVQLFERLTGKTGKAVEALILNWVCLRTGSIIITDFGGQSPNDPDPKQLYIEFMSRFINSIKLPDR